MTYKKPSVTADLVIEHNGQIYLVQRKFEPYKDLWAFPGGFLNVGKETVRQTAKRETKEETGLDVDVEDMYIFHESSDPSKNERGHIVSVFLATKIYTGLPCPGDDAAAVGRFSLARLPKMAFDHEEVAEIYKIWRKKWWT
jgi:8-oxo-dGTP diphosphatase